MLLLGNNQISNFPVTAHPIVFYSLHTVQLIQTDMDAEAVFKNLPVAQIYGK